MTGTRKTTSRRTGLTFIFIACTLLATAGCSAFDTTNDSNTNNGSCNAAGGSNSVNCSQAQTAGATAVTSIDPSHTATPVHSAAAVPAGRKLGEYTVTLPASYYVPVGPRPPTRSEESTSPSGDLEYNTFSGEAYFAPNAPFSTIAPYAGTGVPTYQGCSQDLNTQTQVGAGQGSTFCLFETQSDRVVGGVVTYIDQGAINPGDVTVQLTVWSGSS